MTGRIHRIVAGHQNQDAYAKAFLKYGVVAIGWDIGDISKMDDDEIEDAIKKGNFDQKLSYIKKVLLDFKDKTRIDKGDYVIAYKSPNTVVAVGKIDGDYYYNDEDNLGSPTGLNYPNKRRVKWMEKP